MIRKVAFGCDHGGYDYKEQVIKHLNDKGVEIIDCGTYNRESVDYPVFADKVCNEITSNNAEAGILICGTGIGMSIAANKHRGIRAACCENTYSARMTRAHNDSNVLCFGARVIGIEVALDMIDLFLDTEFMGGRHERRVAMLNDLDK